jgi:hypothetical protein
MEQVFAKYRSKFNNIPNDPDNYLYWLENDILLVLNDNEGLINKLSPTIRTIYPNMTAVDIVDKLKNNKNESSIIQNMHHLWGFLSEDGRAQIIAK